MNRPDFEVFNFSQDSRPKIIAEIGINHGGNLEVAKIMALKAVRSGADIIKFQSHFPLDEMSQEAENRIPGNSDKSIFEIISECSLTEQEEGELLSYVSSIGGTFLSTPFSRRAADHLCELGVDGIKIGSGECNNFPLVKYIAKKGKPVILSTGMNDLGSVKKSVDIIKAEGVPLALMHTTNLYPTPDKLLRLGGVTELLNAFPDVQVGLSDHSTSNLACLGAVALGASFLERHFTDDKARSGPDIACSMDGYELSRLREDSEFMYHARGGGKFLTREEEVTASFAFSSVASTKEIEPGEKLTTDNIWPIRPAGGEFGPDEYAELLGKRAARIIDARVQIASFMIEPEV